MSLISATIAAFVLGVQPAKEPDGPASRELRQIRTADQKARVNSPSKSEMEKFIREDAKRLARVRELLKTDKLRTVDDYSIAALIFQHGPQTDDYLVAHELAVVAAMKGEHGSMPALAIDRFLSRFAKQRFGSQYALQYEDKFGLMEVEEEGRWAVTEGLRLDFFIPALLVAKEKPPAEAIKICMPQILSRAETRNSEEWRTSMRGLPNHKEIMDLPISESSLDKAAEFYQADMIFVPEEYTRIARIIALDKSAAAQWLAHDLATVALRRGDKSAADVWRSSFDGALRAVKKPVRYSKRGATVYPGVWRALGT